MLYVEEVHDFQDNDYKVYTRQHYRNDVINASRTIHDAQRIRRGSIIKGNSKSRKAVQFIEEHDGLVQVLLLLPLTLMACYILFVENLPIYRTHGI